MGKVQEGRFLGPRAWVDRQGTMALIKGPEEGSGVQLHL